MTTPEERARHDAAQLVKAISESKRYIVPDRSGVAHRLAPHESGIGLAFYLTLCDRTVYGSTWGSTDRRKLCAHCAKREAQSVTTAPAPARTILSLDGSTVATGVALWHVEPGQSLRRSLVAAACIVPDPKKLPDYELSSARSYWICLALEAWCVQKGYVPLEVACEERIGHFTSMAPEIDALVRDFRKVARRLGASWKTYSPSVWRSRVGGKDKVETAHILERFLEWPVVGPPPKTELGLNIWDAIGIGTHYLSETRFGELAPGKKKKATAVRIPSVRMRRTDYSKGERR